MVDSIRLYNKSVEQSIILDKSSARFLLDDEGVDWGTVTPNISSYPSIYGLGSQIANITFQKNRDITIIGWMINDATGTISQKKKILNEFVHPLNELRLYTDKYYIDGYPKTSVKYTNKKKENNDTICKFQLTLTCVDPFFRAIKPIEYKDISPNVSTTWSGWSIDLNNTSGIPYGFEMYIKLSEGVSISTLTVTNWTSDKQFPIKFGTTYQGETVYLNTVRGDFAFGSVESIPPENPPEDFDNINMSPSNFEFVQLQPGVNNLTISCGLNTDLGESKLDIYFNPVFMSFEEM